MSNFYRDQAVQNAGMVLCSNDASDSAKSAAQDVMSTVESLDCVGAPESDYADPYTQSLSLQ